ncbi:hypothetical protein [uncultured Tessaracoccus sp.]|uniref:hypothetical protein n=1 Tax=uncultured Tessaracoccus sp. TaxID=905023 RepID=UPI0025CE4702|nr:hypothetical protein [uncultured Tessaracoccus sp.]
MTNALLPALGGPVGAHARRTGPFFRPLPWALLAGLAVFTLLYLRHLPCITTDPGNPINAHIRLCYSDLMVHYSFERWAWGVAPLGVDGMTQPPLLGLLTMLARACSRVLGWSWGRAPRHAYDGLPEFFGVTALLLFAAFLVVIWAGARIAHDEGRDWDVMLLGASPVVLAVVLVNWDLVPLALTALAMLFVTRRRDVEAGVVMGIALAAGTMPFTFALGAAAYLLLRGAHRRLVGFVLPTVVFATLLHLPHLVTDADAVLGYYAGQATRDVSYGSVWFLLVDAGAPLREFAPLTVVLTILAWGMLLSWLYATGRALSLGGCVAPLVLIQVLLLPTYPPQLALWVLLAAFLAGIPTRLLWVLSGVEVAHTLAVWGRLAGHLAPDKTGPWALYHLAVVLRLVLHAVLLALCLREARTSRGGGSDGFAR